MIGLVGLVGLISGGFLLKPSLTKWRIKSELSKSSPGEIHGIMRAVTVYDHEDDVLDSLWDLTCANAGKLSESAGFVLKMIVTHELSLAEALGMSQTDWMNFVNDWVRQKESDSASLDERKQGILRRLMEQNEGDAQ